MQSPSCSFVQISGWIVSRDLRAWLGQAAPEAHQPAAYVALLTGRLLAVNQAPPLG